MYHVKLDCFSFHTHEEAKAFEEALITAFCMMKESEHVVAISKVILVEDETD